MSLIINCGKCDRKMGSLEPHKIREDKYLCVKCFDALEKEQEAIKKVYDSIPDEDISWAFSGLKEPEQKVNVGPPPEHPGYDPYFIPHVIPHVSGVNELRCTLIQEGVYYVNLVPVNNNSISCIMPSPSVNNTITFYNNLGQQLSSGTLESADTSKPGKITVMANITAMFDLFSIGQISFTQNNMFSFYAVNLTCNTSTPDTHYSFLVQLEFTIV